MNRFFGVAIVSILCGVGFSASAGDSVTLAFNKTKAPDKIAACYDDSSGVHNCVDLPARGTNPGLMAASYCNQGATQVAITGNAFANKTVDCAGSEL